MNTYHLFFLILLCSFHLHAIKLKRNTLQTRLKQTQTYSCSGTPINVNFEAVCQMAFFNGSVTGTVTTGLNQDTLITATFPSLIVSKLTNVYLSSTLKALAHDVYLDTITITTPTVMINIGSTQAIRFTGLVSLFGLNSLTIDLITVKGSPNALLVGMSLPFSSIGTILSSVFDIDSGSIFSTFGGSTLSMIVCNAPIDFSVIPNLQPSYVLQISALDQAGFVVYASISLTSANNDLSNFLNKVLGANADLLLVFSVTNDTISGFVGVSDFQITSNLLMTSAGISFTYQKPSPSPAISITGTLQLTVDQSPLIFTGTLSFDAISISMSFQMSGMWTSAFGINRLAFGNLDLSGAMTYEGVPDEFSIGAEIAMGLNCFSAGSFVGNGYCLNGYGYIGIDLQNPGNNYFYLDISDLSIDVILRAMFGSQTQQTITVPNIFQNAIAFPEGLNLSYATQDISLPDLTIQNGFILAGTIQIFDVDATILIDYDLDTMTFTSEILTDSITLGRIFTFYGNDPNTPPYLSVNASLIPPDFAIQLYGTVEVLGISASVAVDISVDEFSFNISGPIYGLWIADLYISTTDANFDVLTFEVKGTLQENTEIEGAVNDLITDAISNAKFQIANTSAAVDHAESEIVTADSNICADISSKCGPTGSCTASITKCTQYGVPVSVCTASEQQCTGGWSSKCTSTTSKCSHALPRWLGGLCKGWDTVCTSSEQVCNAYGEVCTHSITVIDETACAVEKSTCTAYENVANGICQIACDAAETSLEAAKSLLSTSQTLYNDAVNAYSDLASAGELALKYSGKIFAIKSASFEINLNSTTIDGFAIAIDVSFTGIICGQKIKENLSFNFNDVDSIQSTLSSWALDEVKKIYNNLIN